MKIPNDVKQSRLIQAQNGFSDAQEILAGTDLSIRQCNGFTYQIQSADKQWIVNLWPSTMNVKSEVGKHLTLPKKWTLVEAAVAARKQRGLPAIKPPKSL